MLKHVIYLAGGATSAIAVAVSGLLLKLTTSIMGSLFERLSGDKPLPLITSTFAEKGQIIGNLLLLAALMIGGAHLYVLRNRSQDRDFAWGAINLIAFAISFLSLGMQLLSLAVPILSICGPMNGISP